MTERVLTKQNLINLGLFALCFHVVTMHLYYLIDISVLLIVDYVFLGITAAAAILFFATNRIPIRFQLAQMLLILFMLWFIISCISMSITYDNDWVNHNAFPMLNTAVSMFLAFPLGYVWIRERNKTNRLDPTVPEKSGTKRFDLCIPLLHILLICWTVFICYVLIQVFQGKTIPTPNGGIIRMNLSSNIYNCLELNCNRNVTGAWEMLFLLTSFFMAIRCKQLPFKIIYGLSTIIHYIALTLSNSRANIYSALIAFTALVGIAVYLRMEKKQKTHRIVLSLAIALIAGTAFYFLSGSVFSLYNASAKAAAPTVETAAETVVESTEVAASRSTITEIVGDTTFSGRTEIWKYTIDGIFSSVRTAIFGVTPMSVSDMIYQISNNTGRWAHAHNQLLQIAAGNGIPALCIFLAWFFIILKDTYKLIFKHKSDLLFLFVPIVILVHMLSNMMEPFLVYGYEISGFVFFLLCGMLHGKTNEPITKPFSIQTIRNRLRKK